MAEADGRVGAPHPAIRLPADLLGDSRRNSRGLDLADERTLAALEQELTDPALWVTLYEAAKSEARHTAAKRAVEAAYAELEALVE